MLRTLVYVAAFVLFVAKCDPQVEFRTVKGKGRSGIWITVDDGMPIAWHRSKIPGFYRTPEAP